MTDEQPYLVQQGEAQTAVVRALFDSLPRDGWTSCTVEYRKAGRVAESQVSLTGTDGTTEIVKSPLPLITALKRLRELMASQGRGAWLSVTLTAKPDGKCSFDFNYDARPDWTVQPTDETYIADLAQHPRPAELIPSWYPRGS
ncbi:immunity protein YezG family protein [Mycolicibacterium brisbanense]